MLHALNVSNGLLAIGPIPGREGQYSDDLALLRDWRPSLMISLTSRTEMVAAGADLLGPDMEEAGCRWYHLPITDYGIPGEQFEADWPSVQRTALAALKGGGRVLVHCKGGCGRSGMVALRLMIDAGETPEAALTRLRETRPCAVETDDQRCWAERGTDPVEV